MVIPSNCRLLTMEQPPPSEKNTLTRVRVHIDESVSSLETDIIYRLEKREI